MWRNFRFLFMTNFSTWQMWWNLTFIHICHVRHAENVSMSHTIYAVLFQFMSFSYKIIVVWIYAVLLRNMFCRGLRYFVRRKILQFHSWFFPALSPFCKCGLHSWLWGDAGKGIEEGLLQPGLCTVYTVHTHIASTPVQSLEFTIGRVWWLNWGRFTSHSKMPASAHTHFFDPHSQ